MNNQKILRGTVISNVDITQSGKIKVSLGDSLSQDVIYTSPYIDHEAGFFAVPNVGATVLVLLLEDSFNSEYYYIGSVLDVSRGTLKASPQLVAEDSILPKAFKNSYATTELVPQKMGFSSPLGHEFSMSYRNSKYKGIQDYKIQMQSGSGKCIRLVDSPKVDGIIMENEHKGKCYFIWCSTSREGSNYSEGEWFLQTHGPIKHISTEGSIDFLIKDGLNINIVNESVGAKSANPDKTNMDDAGAINLKAAGNINIEAVGDNSVINIKASGSNSRIVVNTEGSVDIVSKKDIRLVSSEGNVVIQAAGVVDIDGTQILLN